MNKVITNVDQQHPSAKRLCREQLIKLARSPMYMENILGHKSDDNYVYHVAYVSGKQGGHRIAYLESWGYEKIITDEEHAGDIAKLTATPTHKGSGEFVTNRGERFVVMRIPKELYDENQEIKHNAHEDQLKVGGNDVITFKKGGTFHSKITGSTVSVK